MVFQDYALYPHMDVARNISFALRLQKLPKAEIETKVKQVAETVGLTDFNATSLFLCNVTKKLYRFVMSKSF